MTAIKKIFDAIIYISVGFTVVHGLLFLLIIADVNLYHTLCYHYSNDSMWYILVFGLPLMAGITFSFWIKKKNVSKGVKFLFGTIFVIQLTFLLISTSKNKEYWGYSLKRPTVFRELSKASTILECSRVTNYDSTGIKSFYIVVGTTEAINPLKNYENLYQAFAIMDTTEVIDVTEKYAELCTKQDPYYDNFARPFMVFLYNSHRYSDLYNFQDVYEDKNRNIPENELLSIDNQIKNTGFIDKGKEKSHYDQLGQLNGLITKFQTNKNKTYIFAGFGGQEISNDHYPHYEFLFIEDNGNYNLIKKQKYYTDFAGFEGLEYANFAPLFSLLLTIVGVVIFALILWIGIILKMRCKN